MEREGNVVIGGDIQKAENASAIIGLNAENFILLNDRTIELKDNPTELAVDAVFMSFEHSVQLDWDNTGNNRVMVDDTNDAHDVTTAPGHHGNFIYRGSLISAFSDVEGDVTGKGYTDQDFEHDRDLLNFTPPFQPRSLLASYPNTQIAIEWQIKQYADRGSLEHLFEELMAQFQWASELSASAEELYSWHLRPGAFSRLVPPWEPVHALDNGAEGIEEGTVKTLRIGYPPFVLHWTALHKEFEPGHSFVDEQLQGPFSSWRHHHRFEDGRLRDDIEFRPPLGLPVQGLIRPRLERMFRFRHQRTAEDLKLHARYPEKIRVAITGSSGLIGGALSALFTTGGHQLHRLVRSQPTRPSDIRWQPELDLAAAEGLDAVVHLAGEPVMGIWTRRKKQRIHDSRVLQTQRLCEALSTLDKPPRTLVLTSATGYFGDRGDQVMPPR